jgi:hypothetical protein
MFPTDSQWQSGPGADRFEPSVRQRRGVSSFLRGILAFQPASGFANCYVRSVIEFNHYSPLVRAGLALGV